MSSLQLVLITIMLIASAHGASVAGMTGGKNCSISDHYLALSCGMRALEFKEKLGQFDVEDDEYMKEFKRTCTALDDCTKTVGHCEGFQDEEVKHGFAGIKTYCTLITFFAEDFEQCVGKLETKNSTCYKDWNPFGVFVELHSKTNVPENCELIFGKENCLKKETIETCGQKEWEKIRDNLLAVDDTGKKCNLSAAL